MESLEARILEIILYVKFSRLMGLKSANVAGDLDFAMRAKKKVFEALWILFVRKKCCTAGNYLANDAPS